MSNIHYCDKCGEIVTNFKGINIPIKIKDYDKWSKWNLFTLFLLRFWGLEPTYVDLCNKCRVKRK